MTHKIQVFFVRGSTVISGWILTPDPLLFYPLRGAIYTSKNMSDMFFWFLALPVIFILSFSNKTTV